VKNKLFGSVKKRMNVCTNPINKPQVNKTNNEHLSIALGVKWDHQFSKVM
jgi:hypothetical protein